MFSIRTYSNGTRFSPCRTCFRAPRQPLCPVSAAVPRVSRCALCQPLCLVSAVLVQKAPVASVFSSLLHSSHMQTWKGVLKGSQMAPTPRCLLGLRTDEELEGRQVQAVPHLPYGGFPWVSLCRNFDRNVTKSEPQNALMSIA